MIKQLNFLDDAIDFYILILKTISIEEYFFVYKLNEELSFMFNRKEDHLISFKKELFKFPVYHYYDKDTDNDYELFSNFSFTKNTKTNSLTLFDEFPTKQLLLKQYSKYNYIIKSNEPFSSQFQLKLNESSYISNYQLIDKQSIKNINNLIISI